MTIAADLPSGVTRRELRPVGGGLLGSWTGAWSPDGKRLATADETGAGIWEIDVAAGTFRRTLHLGRDAQADSWIVRWHPTDPSLLAQVQGNTVTMWRLGPGARDARRVWSAAHRTAGGVWPSIAFSPDGDRIAVLQGEYDWRESRPSDLVIFDVAGGDELARETVMSGAKMIAWAPTGDRIATVRPSAAVQVSRFDNQGGTRLIDTELSFGWATSIAWSPDGRLIAAIDDDEPTVRILDIWGGVSILAELEGHTGRLYEVAFAAGGRLLFSFSEDSTARCWRTDTWKCVAEISAASSLPVYGAFMPGAGSTRLARRGSWTGIELWDLDLDVLVHGESSSRTYRNAKVVLVGDTGVGKSGLGLVLSGHDYRATDSTHARQVFTFDESDVDVPGRGTEKREILLWDLAGQPGYRQIHQLHLAEAAAALVVFDARNEQDPFGAVRYWMRALKQSRAVARPAILVAARVDRGGIPASPDRIQALCADLGFTGYFETSAREGWKIADLAEAVRKAIDWDALPRSISTRLFETIKRFLLGEKDSERILATADDLFRDFRKQHPALADGDLRAGFDTCIRLMEGRDLLRRLSFGDFVLLRPELLDAYASALIDAARGQPDGLGYLAEEDAVAGRFNMPDDERLQGPGERLLLIATVEELLRHELALRERTDGGVDLVFPSQFTAEREAPADATADVILRFEGSLSQVYATLAVRLSHVAAYRRDKMWRNASTYRAKVGGICGLRVRESGEGVGELTVFFDAAASEETRFTFEDYVQAHVTARALPGSVERERVFTCPGCAYRLDADLVRRRLGRGAESILCPACEEVRILLLDHADRLRPEARSSVQQMNASADRGRDLAAATATIRGKETAGDYDVLISYNTPERPAVASVAEGLREAGLLPWLDTRALDGGDQWQAELAAQIRRVRAVAVFLGPHGLGRWQSLEVDAIVHEHTRRATLRVIPVLLPGLPEAFEMPTFLSRHHAVDFRETWPPPFDRLVRAVSGEPRR